MDLDLNLVVWPYYIILPVQTTH